MRMRNPGNMCAAFFLRQIFSVDPDAQFKVSGLVAADFAVSKSMTILIVQVSDMLIERLHAVLVPAQRQYSP